MIRKGSEYRCSTYSVVIERKIENTIGGWKAFCVMLGFH